MITYYEFKAPECECKLSRNQVFHVYSLLSDALQPGSQK